MMRATPCKICGGTILGGLAEKEFAIFVPAEDDFVAEGSQVDASYAHSECLHRGEKVNWEMEWRKWNGRKKGIVRRRKERT